MTKVYVLSITETWEVCPAGQAEVRTEHLQTRIRVFASEQRAIHAEEAAHMSKGMNRIHVTGFARLVDVSTSIVQQEIIQ